MVFKATPTMSYLLLILFFSAVCILQYTERFYVSVNTQDPAVNNLEVYDFKEIEVVKAMDASDFNILLKRNLNMLAYINYIENSAFFKREGSQLRNLSKVKESVQLQIISISQKLNHSNTLAA